MIDRVQRPYIIGIIGPSGSGKSYFASHLLKSLHHLQPVLVRVDSYYKELSHLSMAERNAKNFDEPHAIDSALLIDHIQHLIAFKPIPEVQYDFAVHNRKPTATIIPPSSVVIMEGLFTFHWPEIRQLLDYNIMIDTDLELCFQRRLKRDVEERGRTPESVHQQYNAMVKPAIDTYILPQRKYADLVLDGARNVHKLVSEAQEAIQINKYMLQVA